MAKRIRITKGEAEVLFSCADQMSFDFYDYYSSMFPKKTVDRMHKDFMSGMEKLIAIMHRETKNKGGDE